jgi:hypothetical protein
LLILDRKLIFFSLYLLLYCEKIEHDVKNIIINLIINIYKTKKLFFLRHAQSYHNIIKDKEKKKLIYDPGLTKEGIKQTKELINNIKSLNVKFECIFLSPLRRSFETFLCLKESLYNNNNEIKVYLTDFLREILNENNINKGKCLNDLKKILTEKNLEKEVNLNFITKEFWWFDLDYNNDNNNNNENNNYEPFENGNLFFLRILIFLLWMTFRKENEILLLSHSKIYRFINIKKIKNGNINMLDNKTIVNYLINFIQNFDNYLHLYNNVKLNVIKVKNNQ